MLSIIDWCSLCPDRNLITCRVFMIRVDDGTVVGDGIHGTRDRTWRRVLETTAVGNSSNRHGKNSRGEQSNIDSRNAHGPDVTVTGSAEFTLDALGLD